MSKKIYFQYTPLPKTAWDELPMSEKTDIMKSCVRNGISSFQDVRTAYNNYAAGRNILEGIPDYQANAAAFSNFLAEGGKKDSGEKVVVHQPHYAYDENGKKTDDTLYYNVDVTMPEITVIPDSRKSPAQRNEDERYRQRFNRNYAEQQARDYTTRQSIAAQREWQNSPQKKALDLGIAAAQGIGMASDVVSPFFGGIPVYSGLKGAQALDRATTTNELGDYVDAALWLSPMLTVAGKKVYDAAKPTLQAVIDNGGFALKNPFDNNIVWLGRGLGSHIEVSPTKDGWLGVDYIESTRKGNGRRLYDAAIKEAQRQGYKGVKTGTSLASAPKTYNIWKHYPDKTFLGNYGSHGNGNMINGNITVKVSSPEELIEATKQGIDAAVIKNAPVYGLTTPSKNAPLLSVSKVKRPSFTTGTPAAEWTREGSMNASYLDGKPEIGMYFPDGKTFNTKAFAEDLGAGIADARLFLGSEVKAASDTHNIELAKRLGFPKFMPYATAQERASIYVKPQLTVDKSTLAGSVEKNTNNPALDKMTINVLYDADKGGFHETLHRGNYGEAGYFYDPETMDFMTYHQIQDNTRGLYDFKTKKLLVPKTEENAEWHDYMSRSAEAATNSMELGRRMGLKPGAPWPGRKKAMELFEKYATSDDQKTKAFNVLNWRQKPRRVWDALTGRYFVLGAGAVSTNSLTDN